MYRPELEEALHAEYANHLKHELSEAILQPDFTSDQVMPMFKEEVTAYTPQVVGACVKSERFWSFDESKPVTCLLGDLATRGEIEAPDADAVEIPQEFVDDLHGQLEAKGYDFSLLDKWSEQWRLTGCMELARKVDALARVDDEGASLSEIHEIITEAILNPDYTLPLSQPEALYLITFLPHSARRLVRRAIANNFVAASLESELDSEDPEAIALLGSLKRYFALDALEGSHWDNHIKWHGGENALVEKLAYLGAEKLDVLADMQRQAGTEAMKQVSSAWLRVTDRLNSVIDGANNDANINIWQLEDIGHCFQSFRNYDLMGLLGRGRFQPYNYEYADPTKDGTKAFILEDDPQQLARWQRVVNEHSAHESPNELCTPDPEVTARHHDDMEISLFLLDTQIGDDEWAGLRAARSLFEARSRAALTANDTETVPKTKIVLWSSSQRHVEGAKAALKDLEEMYFGHTYIRVGETSGSHVVVSLEVRLKTWQPYNISSPKRDTLE